MHMLHRWLPALLLVLLIGSGVAQEPESIARTLTTRAEGDVPEFTLLSELVASQTAPAEALGDLENEFTLFAPTDAAIQAFLDERGLTMTDLIADDASLSELLLYHIAEGAYAAQDLALLEGDYLSTMRLDDDLRIGVDEGTLQVDNATITEPNIRASNGFIHVIDTVLMPDGTESPAADLPTIGGYLFEQASADTDREFSVLLLALSQADPGFLARLTDTDEALTFFAPTDEAFAQMLERLELDRQQAFSNEAFLNEVLAYHLVDEILLFEEILLEERLPTVLTPAEISVVQDGEATTLNSTAQFIVTDIPVANGVLHIIDTVLLPPDPGIDGVDELDDTPLTTIADVLTGYTLQERSPEFVVLREALEQTGLLSELDDNDTPLTLLAPTDAAFEEVGITVDNVDERLDETRELLLYHLIEEPLRVDDLRDQDTITTLRGDAITVTRRQRLTFNNGAQVIIGNIEASNGVIHMIDDVLPAPAAATSPGDDN